MPETPNHGYNVPAEGQQNWHEPLNENFERHDTDIEIRDTADSRADYEPKAGAKFLATDTGRVYVGDGEQWELLGPRPAGADPASATTDLPAAGRPLYMTVRDSGGNRIRGDVSIQGREDTIEVHGTDHRVYAPYDDQEGLTGPARHGLFTVTKRSDSATPLLYNALLAGETLQSVRLDRYATDGAGEEFLAFSVTLENVRLQSIRARGASLTEQLRMLYGTITWTVVDGNIEFSDRNPLG